MTDNTESPAKAKAPSQLELGRLLAERTRAHACWVQGEQRWMLCSRTTRPGIWSPENREGMYIAAAELAEALHPAPSDAYVRGVVRAARAWLTATPQEFDRHPWLLGVQNGVVDLSTGRMRDADPSLLLTRCTPIGFDPSAKCPEWEKNLVRLFEGDEERAAWFQMAVGMALVGDATAKDHGFVYLLGPSGNGKSTTLKVLVAVLGTDQHAAVLNARDFTNVERHLAWMHKLRGIRLAIVSEMKRWQVDVQKLKSLTGADPITANQMRREDETWLPTHTIFFAANHPPNFGGDTVGMGRRYRPVLTGAPLGETEDTAFEAKMMAEHLGILAWAVRGCVEWQKVGHRLPKLEVIEQARESHLSDEDMLGDWAAASLDFGPEHRTTRSAVVADLNQWRRDVWDLAPLKEHEHGRVYEWLREQGAANSTVRGARQFKGVAVKKTTINGHGV